MQAACYNSEQTTFLGACEKTLLIKMKNNVYIHESKTAIIENILGFEVFEVNDCW